MRTFRTEGAWFWLFAAASMTAVAAGAAGSPRTTFVLFAGSLVAAGAIVHPRRFTIYALPALVLVPATVRLPIPGPDLTPLRIGILLAAAGWLLNNETTRRARRPDRISEQLLLAAAVFVIYVLVLVVGTSTAEISRGIGYSIEALLPALLIWLSIRDKRDVFNAIDWLILIAAIAALLGIYEAVTQSFLIGAKEPYFFHAPERSGGIRVQGIFPHPLVLGATLAVMIPLAVVRAFQTRDERRVALIAALPVMVAALFFTQGRGPWMATLIGVVIVAALLQDQRWAILSTLLAAITLLAFSPFGGGAVNLVRGLVSPSAGQQAGAYTVEYRKELYREVSGYALTHPFGTGPGQDQKIQLFAYVGGSATDLAQSIDNAFAKYALEIGPVGLLLFFVLLGAVIRSAWLARRVDDRELSMLASGSCAAIAAMVVTSFTVSTFSVAQLSVIFWATTGVAVAIRKLDC